MDIEKIIKVTLGWMLAAGIYWTFIYGLWAMAGGLNNGH